MGEADGQRDKDKLRDGTSRREIKAREHESGGGGRGC